MASDFTLHQGHVLDELWNIPDESIQCVITSPPYYGLRSYETEPQVWGGDPECRHEFGSTIPFAKQDNRTAEQKVTQGSKVGSNINFNAKTTTNNSGAFCIKCEAWKGELGLEPDHLLYIDHLVEIFAEVKRVLRKDGTMFVNLGDSYARNAGDDSRKNADSGMRTGRTGKAASLFKSGNNREPAGLRVKSLMNIPGRFAIAMTDRLGFVQRNECHWHKRSAMPDPTKDRFTRDFEPIYFFSKHPKYKFNQQLEPAVQPDRDRADRFGGNKYVEGVKHSNGSVFTGSEMRNMRTTRSLAFEPASDTHYAAYPTALIEPYLLAGTDEGDTVLDPFNGKGTTGLVALRNRRNYIGIELLPEYVEMTKERLKEIKVRLF